MISCFSFSTIKAKYCPMSNIVRYYKMLGSQFRKLINPFMDNLGIRSSTYLINYNISDPVNVNEALCNATGHLLGFQLHPKSLDYHEPFSNDFRADELLAYHRGQC